MSAIENVVARFKARKSGSQWIARCPAHDDRSPSMWLKEGDDGRVLLGCRAGCKTEDILAAAEMGWPDLFDSSPRSQVFVPKRVDRMSESSSRPLSRQDIEQDWDDGLLSMAEYMRLLDRWCLGAPDVFPRSRVEVEFDEHGEITNYDLRPLPIGDVS